MSSLLQMLTTRELATELKRAPETLVRWRRLRCGPPFRKVQGQVLYDLTEIREWLSCRGEAPQATGSRSGGTR